MATVEELFTGDVSALARDYPDGSGGFDHSRADLALFTGLLEQYAGDAVVADVLFRRSALMRDKWDRLAYRRGVMTLARGGEHGDS